MSEPASPGLRLDSWKAIAQYLKRDLATVRRWEKTLGLPVHRVGVTGRSVFAYTREIDDWLLAARPAAGNPPMAAPAPPFATASTDATSETLPSGHTRTFRRLWPAMAVLALVLAAAAVFTRDPSAPKEGVRVALTNSAVVARDSRGAEMWRYQFDTTTDALSSSALLHVPGGTRPGVYFAVPSHGRQANDQLKSGTLTLLDLEGRPQRTFSFDDRVTFDGKTYAPPWSLTAFAVTETDGEHRVAVAAHHYVWDPGLVTVLDHDWRRLGTFVHAGWIEGVRWLAPNRLVIAGFSNARDGGMISLLDVATLDGQGPEQAGSRHFCSSCGTQRPLRMFIFPKTEVNQVSGSRFNRAVIQTFEGSNLIARTIEMTSTVGDADVIYEFTVPSFELVRATFSDRYWELHRTLELEGKITHSRAECPDRDGPRPVHVWEPVTGWRTVTS
jgi:hypothetical protein